MIPGKLDIAVGSQAWAVVHFFEDHRPKRESEGFEREKFNPSNVFESELPLHDTSLRAQT